MRMWRDFLDPPVPSFDDAAGALELCGESAYCFVLIPNLWAWAFWVVVVAGQLYLFGFLLANVSDWTFTVGDIVVFDDDYLVMGVLIICSTVILVMLKICRLKICRCTFWIGLMFVLVCLVTTISAIITMGVLYIDSEDPTSITRNGIVAAVCLLVLSMIPHVLRGLQVIFKARYLSVYLAGAANVIVGFWAMGCGLYYGFATTSDSSSELIVQMVSILFIEQLDEQLYTVLQHWCPEWYTSQIRALDSSEGNEANHDEITRNGDGQGGSMEQGATARQESLSRSDGVRRKCLDFIKPPFLSLAENANALELCGQSAYSFILIKNLWARLFWCVVVASQVFLLLYLALQAPDDEADRVESTAKVAGCVLLGLGVTPSITRGIHLILKSRRCTKWFHAEIFLAGCHVDIMLAGAANIAVGLIAAFSGYSYASREAQNGGEFVVEIVATLFIVELDEQLYFVFQNFCPKWYQSQMENVHERERHSGNEELRSTVPRICLPSFREFPKPSRNEAWSFLELCGDSAYCFILIPNLFAYLLWLLIVAGQIFLLGYLVIHQSHKDTEDVTTVGIIAGSLLLGLGATPQILRGSQIILRSAASTCWRLDIFLAGAANVVVGILALVCGFAYALRKATDNSEFIVEVVSILLIEQLDEQLFQLFQYWSPKWYEMQMAKLHKRIDGEMQDGTTIEEGHTDTK